jgi:hypothetical protein
MKNLTAARDAFGSEEPNATGGRSFLKQKLNQLNRLNELNEAGTLALFNLFNQSHI